MYVHIGFGPLLTFIAEALFFTAGRSHREMSGRRYDHLRADGAFLECMPQSFGEWC
jgi:hypothetical protein